MKHSEHKTIQLYCDSITNHLGRFFNDWRQLYDFLVSDLVKRLDANMSKYRSLLEYLHKHSEVKPDVSPFLLQLILKKLVETVRGQTNHVKDLCQRNDLQGVLKMHDNHFKENMQ